MDERKAEPGVDLVPSAAITRRRLMQYGVGAGAGLLISRFIGGRAWAQPIATSLLNPTSIPKYVTPLVIPPAMPRLGKARGRDGRSS